MSELEPGRELDALVAEKVMGWRKLGHGDHDWIRPNGKLDELHDFSTGLGAAWEVVEKVCSIKRGALYAHLDFELQFGLTKEENKYWEAYFYVTECGRDGSEQHFDTYKAHSLTSAPHAICLAALKAVEEEDK